MILKSYEIKNRNLVQKKTKMRNIFLKTIAFIVAGPLFPGIFLLDKLPKKWNNWKSLVTGATLSYCIFGAGFAWLTISNPLAALIVGLSDLGFTTKLY
jgi:hypothetical protein